MANQHNLLEILTLNSLVNPVERPLSIHPFIYSFIYQHIFHSSLQTTNVRCKLWPRTDIYLQNSYVMAMKENRTKSLWWMLFSNHTCQMECLYKSIKFISHIYQTKSPSELKKGQSDFVHYLWSWCFLMVQGPQRGV